MGQIHEQCIRQGNGLALPCHWCDFIHGCSICRKCVDKIFIADHGLFPVLRVFTPAQVKNSTDNHKHPKPFSSEENNPPRDQILQEIKYSNKYQQPGGNMNKERITFNFRRNTFFKEIYPRLNLFTLKLLQNLVVDLCKEKCQKRLILTQIWYSKHPFYS